MPPSGATTSASIALVERIGPTTSGICELNRAMKRVIPPSVICSYTTSATSRPACGRTCSDRFSILTHRAGRVRLAPWGSGKPVSGATGGAVVVVVVSLVVVVGLCFFGAALLPPPHPASRLLIATRATGTNRTERRRATAAGGANRGGLPLRPPGWLPGPLLSGCRGGAVAASRLRRRT